MSYAIILISFVSVNLQRYYLQNPLTSMYHIKNIMDSIISEAEWLKPLLIPYFSKDIHPIICSYFSILFDFYTLHTALQSFNPRADLNVVFSADDLKWLVNKPRNINELITIFKDTILSEEIDILIIREDSENVTKIDNLTINTIPPSISVKSSLGYISIFDIFRALRFLIDNLCANSDFYINGFIGRKNTRGIQAGKRILIYTFQFNYCRYPCSERNYYAF